MDSGYTLSESSILLFHSFYSAVDLGNGAVDERPTVTNSPSQFGIPVIDMQSLLGENDCSGEEESNGVRGVGILPGRVNKSMIN